MNNFYPLTDEETKRFQSFFELNNDNNYYVYLLCDEGKPFYVGKGKGNRCFQHEKELNEKEKEYIKDGYFKDISELLEKENKEKLERIKKAKSNNTFDIAIVKFGLSENEAFMVESAVINCLEFSGIKLANAVNGHSSDREKITELPTEARFVRDFVNKCCPEPINLKGIETIIKENVNFDANNDDIAFISYNDLYPYCKTDIDIWDAIRGSWRMDEKKARKIKYLFAIHNNVINGVYKVKKDNSKFNESEKKYNAVNSLPYIKESNIYEYDTKKRCDEINYLINFLNKNPSLRGKSAEIANRLGREKKDYERVYFYSNYYDFLNDDDLRFLREKLIGKLVDPKELIIPQGSFKYSSSLFSEKKHI